MVINWEEKFLDELCIKISAGGDKPNSFSKIKTDKLNIPVYANGIELDGLQGYTDKATIIENAITISARGTIGFICKRLEPYCPIVRLISVIPKDDIYLDFLYYALHLMICNNSGSSIPQLTVPQLKKNKIKYPKNIDEQKRIAAKLDDAFQKIEALENNTKENIKNVEDLFKSYLNKIFTENTDDWEDKTLDELCYIYIGKTPNRAKKIFWDKNLITDNTWLSIADLKNTKNKFVYSSKEQISDKGAEISKIVKKGTLLLSFKLTIGRVAFAGKDLYTNEAIAQLPIKEDKINVIDKNYLFYYLQFFDYENILKGEIKIKGKTLNKKKLAIIPILFPQIEEQKKIVDKLDIFDNKIQIIKKNYQNKLTLLDNLKKSILNKAFNGEL